MEDDCLPVVITCGDPSGVGPELIEQVLSEYDELAREVVVVGPQGWTERLSDVYGVAVRAVDCTDGGISLGEPTLEGAQVALDAMEIAAEGCRSGLYRGVITGPVSKLWLSRIGFAWPGQTEFFADAWGGEPSMAFVGEQLRVVLATWHIPLSEVPRAYDAISLQKAVSRAHELAGMLGVKSPRIGVCGLNPHAGEGGILGVEERDVLDPALDRLRDSIPGLSRCLPGDTVFFRQRKGDFDVVVAAYHDQGLAAVKTLEFDYAVNVTLGLPYLRVSPDHGTAYGIAGQGKADPSSMLAAIRLLLQLTA